MYVDVICNCSRFDPKSKFEQYGIYCELQDYP